VEVLALAVIVAAGPDQGHDAHHDQRHHRQQQIQHGGAATGGLFIVVGPLKGALRRGKEIVLHLSVILMGQHGAVVDVHHRQHHDHHQRQLDEHFDAVDGVGLHIAGYRRRPRGHRGDHAHRGRRGVDEIGQLGTGNFVTLGDGPHHSAHRQAVEVVVDEDQHAQQHGQQLCGAPGLYGLGGPASEGLRAAALVHQIHHDAQRHQKDDDAHVAAVGQHGDDAVVCAHQRHNGVPWGKLGVQQSAHQTSQKQGRVDLLTDQGQHDGHDGRQ